MKNVTMNGTPVTILGTELREGDKAPDFTLTKNDLADAKLKDYLGKVIILSVVPSIDTSVCSIETARFNQYAGQHTDMVFLTVSKDLPFAQTRWSNENNIKNITLLSDYRSPEFGLEYGVLIRGVHLLTRAVFVIDKQGILKHIQFVPEVSHEPDYKAVVDIALSLK